jgi:hypothetical protein
MNINNNQRPPMNDEPPTGSGPDKITPETPTCPTKKVKCNYWTDQGCAVAVCWMEADAKDDDGVD